MAPEDTELPSNPLAQVEMEQHPKPKDIFEENFDIKKKEFKEKTDGILNNYYQPMARI